MEKINIILNTFKTRDPETMSILWKSLCIPSLLYNTNVLGKLKATDEKVLEHVQRKFTKFIEFGRELSYVDRLKALNMISIQRRREQMALIHIGKELRNDTAKEMGVIKKQKQ